MRPWQTPCNSIFMLFVNGCTCLQTRGTGYQYSICTEIWVIYGLCVHLLANVSALQGSLPPQNFILAFLMKSGFTLSGVVGNSFWNDFFCNASPQQMLMMFRSWVQITALSLNPIEAVGLSHYTKGRYMKRNTRFSVSTATAHSLISCSTEHFTRSRTSESFPFYPLAQKH